MSGENVELFRRAHEAFNAGAIEGFLAYFDPSIEFDSAFAAVDAPLYGHDGLRRWRRELEDAWGDEIRVEVEAYFDLGEQVLAFCVLHGRGRHSGMRVAMPVTQVSTWRDGLMTHFKSYTNREDALKRLGVSKEALEPIDP